MLKRIAAYLKGYEKYAAASPLFVAVETVCQLIIPLLMAYIIDEGIEMEDMGAVVKYGLLMVLVPSSPPLPAPMPPRPRPSRATAWAPTCAGRSLRKSRPSPLRTLTASPPPPSSPA